MKLINCKIQTVVLVPLDENNEEERDLMLISPIREKEEIKWNDGILIEVQPVTSKFVSKGYQNEQTVFHAVVWDASDYGVKVLPISAIKIEEREIDRMMRVEWR